MADEVDKANDRIEQELKATIDNIPPLIPGKPGDCDMCGNWSGRLVKGVCAPCRDKYGLA